MSHSQSISVDMRDSKSFAKKDVSLGHAKTHAPFIGGHSHGTAVFTCPHCRAEIMSGAAYCNTCGDKKTGKIENCIYCGRKLPLSIKFCEKCDV